MNKTIKFLEGKKTYIAGLITAVFNLLIVFGVLTLTPEQLIAINSFFLALMGVATRIGINKANITAKK